MQEQYRTYLLRRLHSLSGIMPIGAFFVHHMYSNIQVTVSPEHFDKEVTFLTTLPYVLFLEIFGIFLPIAFHAFYGLFLSTPNRAQYNAFQYSWAANWMYTLQRATGMIALLFICFHVYELRIIGKHELVQGPTTYMAAYFQQGMWIRVIYFIGISAASFHFANGCWNVLIKWGITISPTSQRWAGYACIALGIMLFAGFMHSMVVFTLHDAAAAATTGVGGHS